MKGEFALQLLEMISGAAVDVVDVFSAFLESGYGAGIGKMEYTLSRIRRKRRRQLADQEKYVAIRKRYYNILAWLKEDGLIVEEVKEGKKFLSITAKGNFALKRLNNRKKTTIPLRKYPVIKTSTISIVAFDVPEQQQGKRVWLRSVLKNTGFRMIQKSVWVGKRKLPKEFIHDIHALGMIKFVEIFEATKTGSLREVKL